MRNPPDKKPSARTGFVILTVLAVGVILLAVTIGRQLSELPGRSDPATAETAAANSDDHSTHITRLDDPSAAEINRTKTGRPSKGSPSGSRSPNTTTTASNSTTEETTESAFKNPAYIRALLEQQEKDGKENALIHYALAFELAPAIPTEEQAKLIKLVMDEGWDERAESLLPYLMAWQDTFREIEAGAAVGYARGIGYEKGFDAPTPNFLTANIAAKLLAVYSRYLASKGQTVEAQKYLSVALTFGSDFGSADNTLISHLIGAAIKTISLRQISDLADANQLGGTERTVLQNLHDIEQKQLPVTAIIDTEMATALVGIQELKKRREQYLAGNDPDYPDYLNVVAELSMSLEQAEQLTKDSWKLQSDYLSKPFWERKPSEYAEILKELNPQEGLQLPNFAEVEARMLTVTSKLRQQQIDLAARLYVADHSAPPSTISALVNSNYLPAEPIDPFTGQPFVYAPSGNSYTLYGSGPNIETPNDPNVEYTPVNGTFSEGVIRMR